MSEPCFTVTYSRNWDGGKQEFNSAAECVRAVFPGCKIIENRVDVYPVKVIVTAELGGRGRPMEIWSGRQQNLFSKYASKRSTSMTQIKENLKMFKEDTE